MYLKVHCAGGNRIDIRKYGLQCLIVNYTTKILAAFRAFKSRIEVKCCTGYYT